MSSQPDTAATPAPPTTLVSPSTTSPSTPPHALGGRSRSTSRHALDAASIGDRTPTQDSKPHRRLSAGTKNGYSRRMTRALLMRTFPSRIYDVLGAKRRDEGELSPCDTSGQRRRRRRLGENSDKRSELWKEQEERGRGGVLPLGSGPVNDEVDSPQPHRNLLEDVGDAWKEWAMGPAEAQNGELFIEGGLDDEILDDVDLFEKEYVERLRCKPYRTSSRQWTANAGGMGLVLLLGFGPVGMLIGLLAGAILGFVFSILHDFIKLRRNYDAAQKQKKKVDNLMRWASYHFAKSKNPLQLVFKVVVEYQALAVVGGFSHTARSQLRKLHSFISREDVQYCLWLYLDYFFANWRSMSRSEICMCELVCEVCVESCEHLRIKRKGPLIERMEILLRNATVTRLFKQATEIKKIQQEKAMKDVDCIMFADAERQTGRTGKVKTDDSLTSSRLYSESDLGEGEEQDYKSVSSVEINGDATDKGDSSPLLYETVLRMAAGSLEHPLKPQGDFNVSVPTEHETVPAETEAPPPLRLLSRLGTGNVESMGTGDSRQSNVEIEETGSTISDAGGAVVGSGVPHFERVNTAQQVTQEQVMERKATERTKVEKQPTETTVIERKATERTTAETALTRQGTGVNAIAMAESAERTRKEDVDVRESHETVADLGKETVVEQPSVAVHIEPDKPPPPVTKVSMIRIKTKESGLLPPSPPRLFKSYEDLINFDVELKHQTPIAPYEYEFLMGRHTHNDLVHRDEGWEATVDTKDMKVYKLTSSDSPVVLIKAYAELPGIPLTVLCHHIRHIPTRLKW
eukprot:GHVQ01015910.1.p1 GENE.GHVQ01015910.1~~GHVQ01015910.1.p1  ORF type:complete len:802 (+),score=109.30 GHVQ01015910.1:961-3366(+)